MTDAEKAKTLCIFFQMPSGCIQGTIVSSVTKPLHRSRKLRPRMELRASLERKQKPLLRLSQLPVCVLL